MSSNEDLIKQLKQLNDVYQKKKKSDSFLYGFSSDKYVRLKCENDDDIIEIRNKLPRPSGKGSLSAPLKPKINLRNKFLFLLFFALMLVMIFAVVFFYTKRSLWISIKEYSNNSSNSAWQKWVSTWSSIGNFDKLSNGWISVQREWLNKYNVNLSWDNVKSVQSKYFSYNVDSKQLLNRIVSEYSHRSYMVYSVLGTIIFFFLAMIFRSKHKTEKQRYQEDVEIYNDRLKTIQDECKTRLKYRDLLKEYNEVIMAKKPLYENEYNSVKEEIEAESSQLDREFSNLSSLISGKYYDYIPELIAILESGRADSIKESINVFESDLQKEMLLEEERKRTRILEEERRERERAAKEKEKEERKHRNRMLEEEKRRTLAIEKQTKLAEQQEKDRMRQQKAAEREEKYRQGRFDDAKRDYERQSQMYNMYIRDGNMQDAARAKTYMDSAYAEMLKYK